MTSQFEIASARLLTALVMSVSIGACASGPSMTIDQITEQYAEIGTLQAGVQNAEAADAAELAPKGFEAASEKLDEAISAARDGDAFQANSLAAQGIKQLGKVNQDLERSKDVLREVLEVRERADEAGAPQMFPEKNAEMEASLRSTAALIERGDLEGAKKRRQSLIDGYAELELAALKGGIVEAAQAAIESAKEQDAKKYAPNTFKAATEELALARSILDADRTDTDKANAHAKQAQYLANRSAGITELIKDMDRRKFDREEVVLWYQDQLDTIYEPVGEALRFDQSNREVVLEMQGAYATLIAQRDEVAAAKAQEEVRLELTEEELALRNQMTEAERARFEKAQSAFTPSEATVYRKMENVLISAHGFDFPSGQSEINTDNFVLLNKVIKVIGLFPNSTIQISGHTDSTGSKELNMKLSKERAANVAKFLNEVGEIPLDRLSSEGFGSERPVASNETAAGRAENRRVEILIVNQ